MGRIYIAEHISSLPEGEKPSHLLDIIKEREVSTLLKFIIIFAVLLCALFIFLLICGPSIRKLLDDKKRQKKREAFGKHMKDLEIKDDTEIK